MVVLTIFQIFCGLHIKCEATEQATLASSNLWYARILRNRFPTSIPIHGWNYPINELPCLPNEITKFDVTTGMTTFLGICAVQIQRSVSLDAVPSPFEIYDGVDGQQYMILLQAYMFSADGKLIWEQQGYPQDSAWDPASGATKSFILINSFTGSLNISELIIVACGDPLLSSQYS